jgi:imidazolonepropionase-like amidohydrolase
MARRLIAGIVTTLGMLLAAGCTDQAPPASGTAFENVTVIDAVHGVRADQRVVIVDEQIVSVAAMAEPAQPVAEVIDGTGRYLIPGLWDMHVHFLFDEALTDAMPALFLRYGVTSVRDTGGDVTGLAAFRERVRSSGEPAPRIFLSGPLLDGRHVVYDGGDPGRPHLGIDVAAAAVAERRVDDLVAAGADFIKIYELVNPDVFAALVAAARARNLPIAAHVPLTMTADDAGPQVDSMEHLRNVELACAGDWQERLAARRQRIAGFEGGRGFDLRAELHASQRLPAIAAYDAERCDAVLDALADTIQVPTLRLNAFDVSRPDQREDWTMALAGLPPTVAAAWSEATIHREAADTTFADWSLFLTGRMHERGVPIGAGTDTPITFAVPGYSLHTELALLVRSGLTPLQALHAATVVPAQFFDLADQMGTIAPGMAADLVLLDADPLADIDNTRRILGVMTRGRWVPATDPAPAIAELELGAGPDSAEPHLAGGGGLPVVLSWLEPTATGTALRFATLIDGGWTHPRTLREGDDWFVNWADFPSVEPLTETLWAAHWLRKQRGGPFAYDVVTSVSRDGGASWSGGIALHDDQTPTEHGFVSLFPWGSDVGALWLDGRETLSGGGMTLRAAVVDESAEVRRTVVVDDLVCDCCQTDVAIAASGPVAVYRDRSPNEIRDVHVARAVDGRWQPGYAVAEDGWHITGCPVNGPAIDARGDRVAVAWYTAADDRPRVQVARSEDSAATFQPPVKVAAGTVAGRVDVVLDAAGDVIVSWLAEPAATDGSAELELRVRRVSRGTASPQSHAIGRTGAGRPPGFPQMQAVGDRLLFAWTDTRDRRSRVRTALVDARSIR